MTPPGAAQASSGDGRYATPVASRAFVRSLHPPFPHLFSLCPPPRRTLREHTDAHKHTSIHTHTTPHPPPRRRPRRRRRLKQPHMPHQRSSPLPRLVHTRASAAIPGRAVRVAVLNVVHAAGTPSDARTAATALSLRPGLAPPHLSASLPPTGEGGGKPSPALRPSQGTHTHTRTRRTASVRWTSTLCEGRYAAAAGGGRHQVHNSPKLKKKHEVIPKTPKGD